MVGVGLGGHYFPRATVCGNPRMYCKLESSNADQKTSKKTQCAVCASSLLVLGLVGVYVCERQAAGGVEVRPSTGK